MGPCVCVCAVYCRQTIRFDVYSTIYIDATSSTIAPLIPYMVHPSNRHKHRHRARVRDDVAVVVVVFSDHRDIKHTGLS